MLEEAQGWERSMLYGVTLLGVLWLPYGGPAAGGAHLRYNGRHHGDDRMRQGTADPDGTPR